MASVKILVVEDDVNLLATLKYNLSRESYDVVTALDGTQQSYILFSQTHNSLDCYHDFTI